MKSVSFGGTSGIIVDEQRKQEERQKVLSLLIERREIARVEKIKAIGERMVERLPEAKKKMDQLVDEFLRCDDLT